MYPMNESTHGNIWDGGPKGEGDIDEESEINRDSKSKCWILALGSNLASNFSSTSGNPTIKEATSGRFVPKRLKSKEISVHFRLSI